MIANFVLYQRLGSVCGSPVAKPVASFDQPQCAILRSHMLLFSDLFPDTSHIHRTIAKEVLHANLADLSMQTAAMSSSMPIFVRTLTGGSH